MIAVRPGEREAGPATTGVEVQREVAGVLGRRAAAEQAHRPEALLGEFRLGEERVRHIVLGSPLAPQLATTPPAWARCVPETETPTASTSTHG